MTETELKRRGSVEGVTVMLRRIIDSLVDYPTSVEVVSEELDGATCFRVRVGEPDMGKLIGQKGRTARSIRTILGATSVKLGQRFTLDLVQERDR